MVDEIVGSKEKALNRYGQNGYAGPSSDTPGKHTTSGFLPQASVPNDPWQTRKVDASPIAPAHGMKSPAAPDKIGGGNIRQPSKRQMGGHFQRG